LSGCELIELFGSMNVRTAFDTDQIGEEQGNGGSFLEKRFARQVHALLWILSVFILRVIRF